MLERPSPSILSPREKEKDKPKRKSRGDDFLLDSFGTSLIDLDEALDSDGDAVQLAQAVKAAYTPTQPTPPPPTHTHTHIHAHPAPPPTHSLAPTYPLPPLPPPKIASTRTLQHEPEHNRTNTPREDEPEEAQAFYATFTNLTKGEGF